MNAVPAVRHHPFEAIEGPNETGDREDTLEPRDVHRAPQVPVDHLKRGTVVVVEPGEHLVFEKVAVDSEASQGILRGVPPRIWCGGINTLKFRRHIDAIRGRGFGGRRGVRVKSPLEKSPVFTDRFRSRIF